MTDEVARLRAMLDRVRCGPDAFDEPTDLVRQVGFLIYNVVMDLAEDAAFGDLLDTAVAVDDLDRYVLAFIDRAYLAEDATGSPVRPK